MACILIAAGTMIKHPTATVAPITRYVLELTLLCCHTNAMANKTKIRVVTMSREVLNWSEK